MARHPIDEAEILARSRDKRRARRYAFYRSRNMTKEAARAAVLEEERLAKVERKLSQAKARRLA